MQTNRGFILIEVVLSMLLVSITFLSALNVMLQAVMQTRQAYYRTQAVIVAFSICEELSALAEVGGAYHIDKNRVAKLLPQGRLQLGVVRGNNHVDVFWSYWGQQSEGLLCNDKIST